jgi:hypothetical protein
MLPSAWLRAGYEPFTLQLYATQCRSYTWRYLNAQAEHSWAGDCEGIQKSPLVVGGTHLWNSGEILCFFSVRTVQKFGKYLCRCFHVGVTRNISWEFFLAIIVNANYLRKLCFAENTCRRILTSIWATAKSGTGGSNSRHVADSLGSPTHLAANFRSTAGPQLNRGTALIGANMAEQI